MNKIFYVIFISLVCSFSAYSQTWGTAAISFSALNSNNTLRSTIPTTDISTEGRGFIMFSLDYWYPVNYWLSVESGLSLTDQFSREIFPKEQSKNDRYISSRQVTLPVGFRANFLKYFYANSGMLIDVYKGAGVGSYLGLGVKIDSKIGLGMFVNPYVQAHSILPFRKSSTTVRFVDAGIKIGVSYSLDNILRPLGRGF